MEPRMRELVLERLAILRARLPTAVTLDDFLWESDVRDAIMPRDWEIAAAVEPSLDARGCGDIVARRA